MNHPYPDHLAKLIALLKKLPGVGSKSAERFAFHLLEWPEEKLLEMGGAIASTKKNLGECPECGCLTEETRCRFCSEEKRESETMCVVASLRDVFSIEQTHEFQGIYHVLGGVLSPLQGASLSLQAIEKLKERVLRLQVKEMILALDSTLEGDTTALYLKKELEGFGVTISRLALGMPMGSSLDYIDGGTLARALSGRHRY